MSYPELSIYGPIIVVEDDEDDQFMFDKIFDELKVADTVIYFTNPVRAFDYLKQDSVQPFIILSDINLPVQSGIEFKRSLDRDPQLREKSVPFVFLSTSADRKLIEKAFKELTIQGFFQKNDSYEQLKHQMYLILDYWQHCKHPNIP